MNAASGLRLLGLSTISMGVLYLPPVLERLWNLEAAPIGGLWSILHFVLGTAMCSREYSRSRSIVLWINGLYHGIWGVLILSSFHPLSKEPLGLLLYLMHFILVSGSAWLAWKLRNGKEIFR